MQDEEKLKRMLTAPVGGLVCRLAVPSIIIMLITALYNTADTYFVGSIGTEATAAVGIVFSLMAIIQALGFFFGHGSGNYISRALGSQNTEGASQMASTAFFSTIIVSAVLGGIGLIFLEPLARLLGATETILPYACDYLRYILIAAPWMTSSLMLNNLLRYQGSAAYAMIGMVTGALLNIGLDPLFIFVFKFGVSGAAIATMISQFISFCLLLFGCSLKGNIPIRFRDFKPSFACYKEIIRGGLPSLLRQGLASVSVMILNHMAGLHGDAVIAAISIVNRVTMIAASTLIGFGQGFQPVCGFNYGAGRYDRVKKAFGFCVKLCTALLLVIMAVALLFSEQIIGVFRDDPVVIEIGAQALRYQAMVIPMLGFIVLSNMMLQTIGKAGKASILAVARQGLFLMPILLILAPLLGVLGIQISQPLSDICSFILTLPLTISVLRELSAKQLAGENPTELPADGVPEPAFNDLE